MSRSVMTASNSTAIAYIHLDDDNIEDWQWQDFLEDICNVVQEKFKSFVEDTGWESREVRYILRNSHAQVTVSEYCGLVAVCLVPRTGGDYSTAQSDTLAESWCNQVSDSFVKHIQKRYKDYALVPMGRASNGEQFFRPVNRPGGVVTSKEGVLW